MRLATCVHNGHAHRAGRRVRLSRSEVRAHVTNKAIEVRRQVFSGAAMLPMAELEYAGVTEKLAKFDKRFTVRADQAAA